MLGIEKNVVCRCRGSASFRSTNVSNLENICEFQGHTTPLGPVLFIVIQFL